MLFYFTGTGNTLWAARQLSRQLGDNRLIAIGDHARRSNPGAEYRFDARGERHVGFALPVHSWGIPPIARRFMRRLALDNLPPDATAYALFTCGDECGHARRQLARLAARQGLALRHAYSVQMPNNYISLPGFDIDAPDLQRAKVAAAARQIPSLAQAIANDKPVEQYVKGKMTFLKSGIVYPLFAVLGMSARPFRASDACDGCGLCARQCPTGNIALRQGRPRWGADCTQCLGCIHRCPRRAIDYGRATAQKGRYHFTPALEEKQSAE